MNYKMEKKGMKKVQDLIKKFGFIVIVFSVFIMTLTSSKVQAAEVTITRAQWLHDLTQLFGITVKQDDYPDNYFNDIDSEDEYYQDIMTAAEFGLVDIEAGEKVRPADPVTREFAVYTMNLCMGYTANVESTYDFDDQRRGSRFCHRQDQRFPDGDQRAQPRPCQRAGDYGTVFPLFTCRDYVLSLIHI